MPLDKVQVSGLWQYWQRNMHAVVHATSRIPGPSTAEPVVKLVPVSHQEPVRKFGSLKGKLAVADSFFAPLPDAELASWE